MDSFEKWMEQARSALDYAGQKTGEFIDKSKVRIAIGRLEYDIRKNFEKIGNIIYNQKKSGDENEELVDRTVQDLDKMFEEIARLRESIGESGTCTCRKCGRENPVGSCYCNGCGERIEN